LNWYATPLSRNALGHANKIRNAGMAETLYWAKRRRKTTAKFNLRLNLQSFLPQCAIIDTARFHDSVKV
jgi:hypothetical protein